LIKQVDDQIALLENCADIGPKGKALNEARNFRKMLVLLNSRINGNTTFHVQLVHMRLYKPFYPFPADSYGQTFDDENTTDWATIYFNDGPWDNWSVMTGPELTQLLFHELTHLAGTEDNGSEGLLLDANMISGMINGSFTNNTLWRTILRGTCLNPTSSDAMAR
jgi:hypothetical protein